MRQSGRRTRDPSDNDTGLCAATGEVMDQKANRCGLRSRVPTRILPSFSNVRWSNFAAATCSTELRLERNHSTCSACVGVPPIASVIAAPVTRHRSLRHCSSSVPNLFHPIQPHMLHSGASKALVLPQSVHVHRMVTMNGRGGIVGSRLRHGAAMAPEVDALLAEVRAPLDHPSLQM